MQEVRIGSDLLGAEQIIGHLREACVKMSKGAQCASDFREMGIAEQTYYRCRLEYGGIKVYQARRPRDLGIEYKRLKKAVADLSLDKLILKEALEGKDYVPTDEDVAWNTSGRSRTFPSGVSVGRLVSQGRPGGGLIRFRMMRNDCGRRLSGQPADMVVTATG
ncbi:MAG: hypothetical protein HPY65_00565 [Syntrophaceae bacterium]|nr:hypothetical protein [Syntrophaceae bacterium]